MLGGTDMTLCIGALSQHAGNPRIVLCFDSKISADEFASETEYKFHRLNGKLVSMFSGAPGRAKELAWIYREFLRTVNLDKQQIIEQLREPITTFKRRLANAYLGRTLELSYDDFLTRGTKSFGKDFQRRLGLIEDHPLRVDLIIAGFLGQFPVLCELRNGELELRTNYSMIGTGVYTAEPSLHSRKQQEMTTVHSTMYNVYEAKKLGEASPHVGKFTTMLVLSPPDAPSESMHIDVVQPEGLNYLDNLYDQYGPKPMPCQYTFPEEGVIRAQ
jgi:hypothetical protein